jgi:hypothetical protein
LNGIGSAPTFVLVGGMIVMFHALVMLVRARAPMARSWRIEHANRDRRVHF